jgi:anti-sigma regulatory factor (Ser/Thr protein kinase)
MWFREEGKMAVVELIDRGVPYDPLAKEDPDVTLSLEKRAVGGLGIFMVKKSVDRMRYNYEDGCNIVTLEKRIAP